MLRITAPLPPPAVHQNARPGSYHARNRATQDYTEVFALAVREQWGPPPYPCWTRARIALEFLMPDRRRRDVLNYAAALKPAIDYLTAARHNAKGPLPCLGIVPDDDWSHVEWGAITMRPARPGEAPGVRITIVPVEGNEERMA